MNWAIEKEGMDSSRAVETESDADLQPASDPKKAAVISAYIVNAYHAVVYAFYTLIEPLCRLFWEPQEALEVGH